MSQHNDITPRESTSLGSALSRNGHDLSPERIESLLAVQRGSAAASFISCLLSGPLAELVGRGGKKIRGRLVELGARFADGGEPDADTLRRLAESVEALHAGSLAIDDLQDGSPVRRGAPALHVKYGVPIAVNVGNLLYFWPAETIAALDLPPALEVRMHRLFHRTLVRAHLGQVIDVGVPIDTVPQEQVHDLCLASMELKSGALFAFSLLLGAVWRDVDGDLEGAISDFGHGLGVGLQMFDDIGNIRGVAEPAKRWEDLILRRPTWIWACASRHFSREAYGSFVSAIHQLGSGDRRPFETWLEGHDFLTRATRLAHDHMERCFRRFEERLAGRSTDALLRLRALAAEISRAYE